ncbi:MAG: glycosyltransferase family 4 protein [Candidatus Cloacimonadales bacterium]|nr:glycosyltransferase family 4 protein [Candidatus Cloacimonadales bacterium]
MKILHVLAQRPGRTGSGVFLQSLIEEADKRNFEQAVVAGVLPKEILSFKSHIKTYPVLFDTKELPFPVVGMSNVMPYQSIRYCDLSENMLDCWKKAFSKQLDRAVKEFNPDIILSHHLWLLSILTKERFPEIPMIVITHGTGLRQMEHAPKLAKYVKKGCKKIDLVLSLNEEQKKQIVKKYHYPAERIIITGTGYNSAIFYKEPKPYSETVKIIYAGKLSPAKGIQSFIRSIGEIKTFNLEFVIIGSASTENTSIVYEMTADTHHPIMFTGALPQHELAQHFRRSDIFVLPSFFEGLPLVLIEAIACRLRIVVSDLPGLREFLGKEFCKSDLISFVPLPRLKNRDIPFKKDLPIFENNLLHALKKQIKNVILARPIPEELIKQTISNWTWENLFDKITVQIDRLVK